MPDHRPNWASFDIELMFRQLLESRYDSSIFFGIEWAKSCDPGNHDWKEDHCRECGERRLSVKITE